MFDEFLRERGRSEHGERVRPVRHGRATTTSTSTASRATTACGRSSSRAGSSCRRAARTTRPSAETIDGLGNRKNEIVLKLIQRAGRRAVRGLGPLRQRRLAARVCARAVVSSSTNCHDVLARRRHRRTCSTRSSTASSPSASTCRASRRPTRILAGAARARRRAGARRRVRGRARRRRGRAGGQLRLRRRRRPRRPGRRTARARRRRRREGSRRAAGASVIDHPAFPVEPWAVRETELDLDRLAQTESVFALANGHIGLRGEPRRGRAVRPARHVPRRLLRAPPAAVRRGRLRLSRRPGQTVVNVTNGKIIRLLVDDEPFDIRYGELRQHERVLDLRAGVLRRTRRVGLARPDARAGPLHAAGVVHAAGGRRRSSTRSSRSRSAIPVVVQSELVANEPLPRAGGRPARGGSACLAAASPSPLRPEPRHAALLVHSTAVERPDGGRRDGPRGRRAGGHRDHGRERSTDLARAARRRAGSQPGEPLRLIKFLAYGWSRRAVGAGACTTRLRRRSRRRHTRAGTGSLAEQRAYLDDFWERADVELDGRPGAPAGGPVRAVSRAPGRRPRRAARDRRQGADRARIRRPHVLGQRDVRAPGAHLHAPRRPSRTRCAGATRTLDLARERAKPARARGRGVPVAHDPRRGVLGLLAGRHGRVPHQRGHRRRGGPLPARRRGRRVRARGRGSSCSSRPRGCGARSGTTTRPGASGSTASPVPTSTARSPTTTSTRT